MVLNLISISLIVLFVFNDQVLSFKCKNEDGGDVDYFVALKPPSQKNDNSKIKTGWGYLYKINDAKSDFTTSEKFINKEESLIGTTFEKVYENHIIFSYLQFNDESPFNIAGDDRVTRSFSNTFKHLAKKIPIVGPKYAKTKGSLIWNDKGAILFLTSAPKFLPKFNSGKYEYSNFWVQRSAHYFVCISLELKQMNEVLNRLIIIEPKIYARNLVHYESLDESTKYRLKENLNIVTGKQNSGKMDNGDIENDIEKKTSSNFRERYELGLPINLSAASVFIESKSREIKKDVRALASSPKMKINILKEKTSSLWQKLKQKDCSKREIIAKPLNILFGKRSNRNVDNVYWPSDERIRIDNLNRLCFGLFKNLNYNRGNMNICIDDSNLKKAYEKLTNLQKGSC